MQAPPKTLSDTIFEYLYAALDIGIREVDFWDMTIGEVDRAIDSYNRIKRKEQEERASYDYILADLIGRSVARLYSSTNKMPEIYEAYPSIFNAAEMQKKKQEKTMELSALRFKQFAQNFNKTRANREADSNK